jgi:predicted metalloprotease with PDZ domain
MSVLQLAAVLSALVPQSPVSYEVSFPNAVHHEAEIRVTFPDLPRGALQLRMSRSSPGRYALHEFAKNVYSVKAFDGSGDELEITRPNPHQWDVAGHDGTVTLSYTLYADHADGTYSGIDATHAHFNMPSAFMWARGLGDRLITITFQPALGSNWRVATQLAPTGDPFTFMAPNLDYFLDSPTELSDFALREWQVGSGDRSYTIRMAVHHEGSEPALDRYVNWSKAIVDEAHAVFGEYPAFDYGTYTFIADYLPWVDGDGMEHRNSTILASTRSLDQSARGLVGTVSHEFFHAWNVERIRPRSLEPFDFERANMSRELWFAEGFTDYYGGLLMRRAGITNVSNFARSAGGSLSYVINAPGRSYFSPIEMSMQAPFVDAARPVDATNQANSFISYYTWGSVIALGLDLTLRTRFDGLDLDAYMRAVWAKHRDVDAPYTVEDLRDVLGELTGDRRFAEDFFRRYVYGLDVMDYEPLLGRAGMLLRKSFPGEAIIGQASLRFNDQNAEITSATLMGSPLYEAGLDRGDVIFRIDGRQVGRRSDLETVLRDHRSGDAVEIEFRQRGSTKLATLTLAENPRLEVVLYEEAGLPVTAEMQAFREAWLGSKAP